MIPFRSITKKIVSIEQSCDVNAVQYNDMKIWPLIRVLLWQQLLNPDINILRKTIGDGFGVPVLGLSRKQRNLLQNHKNSEILFFTNDQHEHTEQINGKTGHPFTDSMIELIKGKHNFLKIELPVSNINKKTSPRFQPSILLSPEILCYDNKLQKPSIKGFSYLQTIIKDCSGILIDEDLLMRHISLTEAWQSFFSEVLLNLRPKIVFVVYYYYFAAMALIRACKKMMVTTVDIQHGACGSYQCPYTHWTKIPYEGYDLIPDFFWCWGETACRSIDKWYSPGYSHHRPIVGGNTRIAKLIENEATICKGLSNLLVGKNMIILLSLGYISDPSMPLPIHVLETLRFSPDNWLWLIRLHPTFRSKNDIDKLEAFFKQHQVYNYEMKYASSCSLYSLLKICSHNITTWSSTYYDALAFKVPTTIVHPSGLEFYEDDYKKNVLLSYADTGEALKKSISKSTADQANTDTSEFIEIRTHCAKSAFKAIRNYALQNNMSEKMWDLKYEAHKRLKKQVESLALRSSNKYKKVYYINDDRELT
jgi:hypothetical protein